jgi:3-methyladenine DNA glycosylase AlkD
VSLVDAVRSALAEAGDPAKAPGMQAYMKSAMPYRGVATPGQRLIYRELFVAYPLESRAQWEATVLELWDGAAYREERYAAIALVGNKAYARYRDPATLPLLDHLIVTGAWWDHVDSLATAVVGPLVRAYPAELVPVMRAWSTDDDLWRRRTAVIHQVGAKLATDSDLLADLVEPSLPSKEFFLRKAIGWALRDYAWSNPAWVQAYVRAHEAALSGLSRREALKNVGPGSPAGVTGE